MESFRWIEMALWWLISFWLGRIYTVFKHTCAHVIDGFWLWSRFIGVIYFCIIWRWHFGLSNFDYYQCFDRSWISCWNFSGSDTRVLARYYCIFDKYSRANIYYMSTLKFNIVYEIHSISLTFRNAIIIFMTSFETRFEVLTEKCKCKHWIFWILPCFSAMNWTPIRFSQYRSDEITSHFSFSAQKCLVTFCFAISYMGVGVGDVNLPNLIFRIIQNSYKREFNDPVIGFSDCLISLPTLFRSHSRIHTC